MLLEKEQIRRTFSGLLGQVETPTTPPLTPTTPAVITPITEEVEKVITQAVERQIETPIRTPTRTPALTPTRTPTRTPTLTPARKAERPPYPKTGAAYEKAGQHDNAIAVLDEVINDPNVHAQIKQFAQAEKARAIEAKSGGQKAETPAAPAQIEIKKQQ